MEAAFGGELTDTFDVGFQRDDSDPICKYFQVGIGSRNPLRYRARVRDTQKLIHFLQELHMDMFQMDIMMPC